MENFGIEPFHSRPAIKIRIVKHEINPLCKLNVNDCGRFIGEKLDCTVRALATVQRFICGRLDDTFGAFVNNNKKGLFILRTKNHVAAVKNGVLFDDGDSSRNTLLEAWEFKNAGVAERQTQRT